jgi:hypothetical protein
MRHLSTLAATLVLAIAAGGCTSQQATREPAAEKSGSQKVQEALAAQHAADEKRRAELRGAASEGKLASINSVCPVTGDAVDPAIAPVTVELMVVSPPEILAIGVATEAAAEAVRHDPERYAPAAKRNRQARSGTTIGR